MHKSFNHGKRQANFSWLNFVILPVKIIILKNTRYKNSTTIINKQNNTMKTNRPLINALFALILMLPLFAMTSCSKEDAPEFSHSTNELVVGNSGATWTWNTVSGDLPDAFEVTIDKLSDTEFAINNFASVDGDRITVKISGTSLTFSGEVASGPTIKEGTGTIKNGWATMDISFIIDNGEEQISCSATLEHEKMISKKKVLTNN